MRTVIELTRAARVAFTCWLALACTGETQVSLLEPIDADAGANVGGAAGAVGVGVGASAGAGVGGAAAGLDAGGPPPLHSTASLVHRYSFDGEGTRVLDSVGNADGTLEGGAMLDGAGHVSLDGHDDYVNLPNGLISSLQSATLIGWVSWNGGKQCWQRAFDFGSNDAGEDMSGKSTSSLFATVLRCSGTGPAMAIEGVNASGDMAVIASIDSDTPFPVLQDAALAVVVDGDAKTLGLFAAGAKLGTGRATPLSAISDVNDWLGRSEWVQDPYLRGTYDEFRIYDTALSDEDVAAIMAAGPDTL